MKDDEASAALLLRIVAGFMFVIAGMGCFVIAAVSGVLFTGAAVPFTILGIVGIVLFLATFLPRRIWHRGPQRR